MAVTAVHLLCVGDKVLFVKSYGEKPITANVQKVTKTGRIRIDPTICSELFVPPSYGDKYETTRVSGYCPFKYAEVYPYSVEKETELIANANRKEANKNIERALKEAQRKEREERLAAELVEVKEAYTKFRPLDAGHLDVYTVFGAPQTLADGTRLYQLHLPVKEEMKERKGGFEIAFVHCKDMIESDFRLSGGNVDEEILTKVVSYASTYIRGVRKGEGRNAPERQTVDSFPSISGGKAANDEEALWETARYMYHSW